MIISCKFRKYKKKRKYATPLRKWVNNRFLLFLCVSVCMELVLPRPVFLSTALWVISSVGDGTKRRIHLIHLSPSFSSPFFLFPFHIFTFLRLASADATRKRNWCVVLKDTPLPQFYDYSLFLFLKLIGWCLINRLLSFFIHLCDMNKAIEFDFKCGTVSQTLPVLIS